MFLSKVQRLITNKLLLVNFNKKLDRLYSQTNRLYNSPPQYQRKYLSLHLNKDCIFFEYNCLLSLKLTNRF